MQKTRDRQHVSNSFSRKCLIEASRNGAQRSHGHIVANLSFGFWAALTRAEREAPIWSPMLTSLYGGRSRGSVHDDMVKLVGFRNRLAHWEPLVSRSTSLLRRLRSLDTAFRSLSPEVALYVGGRSQVGTLLRQVPEPLFRDWDGRYLN